MSDGLGSVSYGYDQLSQLTSETRTLPVGSFALTYGYNLAGELTSVTNPWGAQVGYGYDNTGRLTNVSGANYAGVSNYASGLSYRAFGAVKSMSYGDSHTLSTAYDNRMRPTTWNVSGVLGYNYAYDYFNEHTGRVTYAQSIYDSTLDRSYQYDQVGALVVSHSGAEARAHIGQGPWGIMDGPYSHGYDYDKFGNMTHRYGWGGEVQGGSAGQTSDIWYSYTNNRRDGFGYDQAGNLTNDVAQTYSYDATGQQTTASSGGYYLQQNYDGDGLRAQKTENGAVTYYVRSSVLGGSVVAEIDGSGTWQRGYVYAAGDLLAVQQGGVNWVHEDSVTKSKRTTDISGNIVSTVELDPWGADTNRSSTSAFLPHNFTSYVRDANGGQDAMARRYATSSSRFSQPDPYNGSYDFSDPQSFNRYAYTKNDPVNFVDPTGLMQTICGYIANTNGDGGHWACVELWDSYHWGGFQPKEGGGPIGPDGPQNPALTPEQTAGLRKDLKDMLANPKCGDFAKALLKQLGNSYSDNALTLFNKIAEKKGGFYGLANGPPWGLGGGLVADGSVNVGIVLSKANATAPVFHNAVARTLFHELVHVAAGAGHPDMARAAYAVAIAQGYKNVSEPPKRGSKDYDYQSSVYFESRLFAACKPK